MPDYDGCIRVFLELLEQVISTQAWAGWQQWVVSLLSALVGGILGFMFGWWKDRLKEKRNSQLLQEALYQEIANNYESIIYWAGPEWVNLDWLKQNIY
jgi:membrane protein YqaA with SNARE-associated domain